jgi:hypothetical protein
MDYVEAIEVLEREREARHRPVDDSPKMELPRSAVPA